MSTGFLALSVSTGADTPASFTFGASGSIGSNVNSAWTLSHVGSSGANFFLALGDLSMNGTGSESPWCNFVTSRVGAGYPFELLSGDNEDNGPNGLIDNFTACLPDRIGTLNGTYGKEYYFDYPASNPLARFILISPALTFTNGGYYGYTATTSHYKWLAATIDGARSARIPWVIVGMHKFCISVSSGSCDVSQDLVDLLTAKRVDLVLEAHGPNYQRAKELSCVVRTFYVPECVSNDGSTGSYPKGAGTVFVNAGTGGVPLSSVSTSDTEYRYFVPGGLMGSNTAGRGFGFVTYTVRSDSIQVQTVFSGTYSDLFTIASGAPLPPPPTKMPAPAPPFVFTATADIGMTSTAAEELGRVPSANANFSLALGDLSYNGTGSEPAWCSFVSSRVGASYPFELLSGNHEDNGPDGLIDNFTACLPNRVSALNGTYGKEYSFDYPTSAPLARFILISPALTFTYGGTYTYVVANSHYKWLASRIDDARVKGIPWVIVGMHENCLDAGPSCSVGQDLLDLLAAKRVDLVLNGHVHNYERSKELTCGVRNFYVPECVANDGSSGIYPKGNGTVFNIVGVGGGSLNAISTSVPAYPYFAPKGLMGKYTAGAGFGFVTYTVRPDRIEAKTAFSGTYSDRFTITTPLAADFSVTPQTPEAGLATGFASVVAGGVPPYVLNWTFGDGGTATGATVNHTFPFGGSYTVNLTVTDSTGRISRAQHSVLVAAPVSAGFSQSPLNATAGGNVTFNATAAGGIGPYTFSWDFGDGNRSAGPQAVHAFSLPGTYTVTLSVVDALGGLATASRSIVVS